MIRYIALFLMLSVSLSWSDEQLKKCGDYFDKGVASFEKQNYPQAIQYWESCNSLGVKSWLVFFNLGNAYYRSGDLGKSILNYEKANLYNPADPNLKENLKFVQSQIKDEQTLEQDNFLRNTADKWYGLFGVNFSSYLILGCLFVVVLLLSLNIVVKGSIKYAFYFGGFASGLVLVFLVASTTFRVLQIEEPNRGVILAESVDVLSGPGEKFKTLFELHSGTTFKILEEKNNFYSINAGKGIVGFIPAESFQRIH